jgi:hypothetical protein
MARTYLVFGDIEGKLRVLRVECSRCGRKGRYDVGKLIKKIRTQRQHDEMERAAQRRLSQSGRPSNTLSVRSDLSRSAEGALAGNARGAERMA